MPERAIQTGIALGKRNRKNPARPMPTPSAPSTEAKYSANDPKAPGSPSFEIAARQPFGPHSRKPTRR